MFDIVRRMVWFFVVACAVAYIVFLVLGSTIKARALDQSRVVLVRDSVTLGTHTLSGMVMVPRTCAQLSVTSEKMSETLYALRFSTWEEPSVKCEESDTPRAFRAVVFAPSAGVSFIGTLDDDLLQLSVIPVVASSHL